LAVWTVDPSHASVTFAVRHLGLSTVRGSFGQVTGELDLDPADATKARGTVRIDIGSIDTRDDKRDAHLRSPDFFHAEQHPEMVFEVTSVTPKKGDAYRVAGNLTIRGVTRPVELEAEATEPTRDPWGNERIGVTLTGKLNREDWGLTWNMVLEAGRLVVGKDVKIEIDAELVKASEQEAELVGEAETKAAATS